MKHGYIVGSKHKTTSVMSISDHPRIHQSFASASKEAERLAGLNRDKKFLVMNISRVYAAVEVEETTL